MKFAAEALSSHELLSQYKPSHNSNSKLIFNGVDGYDVYNISQEFTDNGKTYIFGRVEKRTDELSFVRVFEKVSENTYTLAFEDMVFEKFQDPFMTRINGEIVLGGVQIETDPLFHEQIFNWRTIFYKGKTISELRRFAVGPNHMKDIRLCGLENGEVAVFTRPQGEKGGLGKIGFVKIPSLDHLNEQSILSAEIFNTHFKSDEWGGANQAFELAPGLIGVVGHVSCRIEGKLNYNSMVFVFDTEKTQHTPLEIIASRSDLPSGPSKRDDLVDVLFTGGLVFEDNGSVSLFTGVSDCEAYVINMDNPFPAILERLNG